MANKEQKSNDGKKAKPSKAEITAAVSAATTTTTTTSSDVTKSAKSKKKFGTVVVGPSQHHCPINHEYQNKEYNGGRLCNLTKIGTGKRCTVCGKDF